MYKIRLGFAALVLAAGLIPAAAQAQQPATPPSDQPAAQPQAPPAAPPSDQYATSDKKQKLEGELLSVDDATKMLTIRTKDGSEVKVAFNDQTQITGATDQAAGLATAAGSKVKIELTGEGAARTAKKIAIEAKDKK